MNSSFVLENGNKIYLNDLFTSDKTYLSLSINDYEKIYGYFFKNTADPQLMINGKSIKDYHQDNFDKLAPFKRYIADFMKRISLNYNVDLIYETGFHRFGKIFDDMLGCEIGCKKIYVGINLKSNEIDGVYKFVLRNVLKRNFEEGRILSYGSVMDSLYKIRDMQKDHEKNLINYDKFIYLTKYVDDNKDIQIKNLKGGQYEYQYLKSLYLELKEH